MYSKYIKQKQKTPFTHGYFSIALNTKDDELFYFYKSTLLFGKRQTE